MKGYWNWKFKQKQLMSNWGGQKLIVLIIMDGYGLNEETKGNAIKAAKTPNLDHYFRNYPNTVLRS